ncbi:TonB-dependent receptor plug domain-containing protein [Chishuiella sp.]|uniref:TonB-dependent receptor plug domain-containing protein n=1 Tax=Chishuiella sp. TaxID=1969467 RepID=UPI0028A60E32|nr:TonB-dependent receptor plug domain-containing protein [Chishuiella sp.]
MMFLLGTFCSFIFVTAQENEYKLHLKVIDQDSITLQNVNILVDNLTTINTTNEDGVVSISLNGGEHNLHISNENYLSRDIKTFISSSKSLIVVLQTNNIALQEVILTAREDKGLTTKSIINRKAMEHLQPSSFSDLMELLPGGLANKPNLTSLNRALIRESSNVPTGYGISSLGVQFMIDDNIINSNSDMQRSLNPSQMSYTPSDYNKISTGIDMRTISTNDIENVEIIRGIPSAEYGDLTTGLIKIERKLGKTPLQARLKVDGYSKQYYISKGFRLKDNWNLNTSFDFLDAKADPSDNTKNYQRISASIRSDIRLKLFNNPLRWKTNLDFTGNLDNVKLDPDNSLAEIDSYKSYSRKINIANNFIYILPKQSFFNEITLNTSLQQSFDRIEQRQFVQYSGPTTLSTSSEQGENVGIFAKTSFISNYMTDGKPLDMNARFRTNGKRKFIGMNHFYEFGVDWRYSKNNGRGDVYDILQPPSATMTTRPRAFKDIPATQSLAAFLGDRIDYKFNNHSITLYAGLRVSKLLGIDKSYKISDQIFTEPRFNLQYGIPKFKIAGKPFQVDITMGYGQFYKQPTTYYLYPNKKYKDYVQLSYYNNEEQYRYVSYMTYVQSQVNKDLTAAKNIKKEIRVDFSYNNHNLSITYYNESMLNGFRSTNQYRVNTYKKYDETKVDITKWTSNGPDLSDVPFTEVKDLYAYTKIENGTVTKKEGIEFQYSTPRFKSINTRFTLSGAWIKTKYYNNIPIYEKPNVSLGGLPGSFPYIGIYENDDSYRNSNLNYNLMIDTYIPSLDLTFSASVQGSLFVHTIREKIIDTPISYMGLDGITYSFTDADRSDLYKQWLIRQVAISNPLSRRASYNINLNLKITKSIYKALRASMFVNGLYNYENPYYYNNVKVELQNKQSPYFGIEMNYNF